MKPALISWLVGFFLLLFLWWLLALVVDSRVLPAPIVVARSLKNNSLLYVENGLQTALEAFCGMVIGVLISLILVFPVGLFPRIETLIYPHLTMLKATPVIAFVPMIVSMLGVGTSCKVVVSALIAFFPLVVGAIDGIKSVPDRFRLMSEGYGTTRLGFLLAVAGPYSLSGFLTGLKTAAPLSVVGAIVGEYVAGGRPTGIGTYIVSSSVTMDSAGVFAGAVTATAIGLLFFSLAFWCSNVAERRLNLGR